MGESTYKPLKPLWAKDIDVKEKPIKVFKEFLLATVCGSPDGGDELYFLTNTLVESFFHLGLYIEELQQKNIALKCALGKYGRHKDNCNFSSSQPDCNCGYLKAFTDLVIIDKSEFGEEE